MGDQSIPLYPKSNQGMHYRLLSNPYLRQTERPSVGDGEKEKKMKKCLACLVVVGLMILFGAMVVVAADNTTKSAGTPGGTPPGPTTSAASADTSKDFLRPNQVWRQYVEVADGTSLSVQVLDYGLPYDYWSAKVKVWDKYPSEAVTTGSGSTTSWSPAARVLTIGVKPLRALVEVRYQNGINMFPAGMYTRITVNDSFTAPTVTDLGLFDY
jgi:hypothetical protein